MNDMEKWDAVRNRDRSQDGKFFYGVTTTGVYCRPSCTSRRPLRKNVRFYDSPEAAERDGLRPCKRCKPRELEADDPMHRKVQALCRYLEAHATETVTLEAMSRQVNASPFHLQRSFKAIVGVTPKQFLDACRMRSLKQELRDGRGVTDAIYDAGFGSSSRVYERVDTRLGMTPKQYRRGGEGVDISYAATQTPLGPLMIGATDRGLCFVQFGGSERSLLEQLQREYPKAAIRPMPPDHTEFEVWMRALGDYLDGSVRSLRCQVDVTGTAFQMKVWRYLQGIPYGEVRSYAEVARDIGKPAAVRAVANACAANRVAMLIPCHRVIRGDGGLGGYKWGLERKRTLIDMERAGAKNAD
jgi:AraC family transcriptional regulator of adaptative response/methylated-DNA-[protein]-cysteine methyltransferase